MSPPAIKEYLCLPSWVLMLSCDWHMTRSFRKLYCEIFLQGLYRKFCMLCARYCELQLLDRSLFNIVVLQGR